MFCQRTATAGSSLKMLCARSRRLTALKKFVHLFLSTQNFLPEVWVRQQMLFKKEMYTFDTKGGESVTLRPEGTAGAARAVLEHGLVNDSLPIKASYFVSCYRYEKPQAGRLREFHQFGLECYGTQSPVADAELICAAQSIFDRLDIKQLRLEINSIGCPTCRAEYHKALKEYFYGYKDELCETCNSRLEKKSYENTRLQKSRMFKDCTGRT